MKMYVYILYIKNEIDDRYFTEISKFKKYNS